MKLRMARNSLFAVLLRSPWWISLLLAIGVGIVAQALLPREFRAVGSLAGLPFLVIAGIACWRQWDQPSPAQVESLLQRAAGLGWPEFEAALRKGLEHDGWQARPGPAGADLAIERQGRTLLVSARRWKAARHGEDAIAPLLSAMRREGVGGLYVALGELSPQAARTAQAAGIELLQGAALAKVLRRGLPAR